MNKIKRLLQDKWFYIIAFLLPWIIMIIRSIIMDTWVTGNGSLLKGDMAIQIIPFYYELWNKVHTADSFAFTWNIAGGVDFNLILGYLISPFTFLVLLFPKRYIVDIIQFIMILKWSLSAVSMVYFFYHTKHNTLKYRKKEVSLFLGLAFALSNGMINYIMYIQFMDVIILFPFLLLLVEKLVDEKKWKLYYLVLTACIISNNYISFEICLFLIFWFFIQLDFDTTNKIKTFLLFAGISILSALTSFFGLYSGYILSQDRLSAENSDLKYNYIHSLLVGIADYVNQLFIFTPIGDTSSMLPNIFCSVLVSSLILLFLFIKIGRKRKIAIAFPSIILIASVCIGAFSIVWHLFNVPNSVYHRFIFILIFIFLFISLYVFCHLQSIKLWHVCIVSIMELLLFGYTFFNIEKYNEFYVYLITILLMILYLLIIFFFSKKSIQYKNVLLVLILFGGIELCANAYNAFGTYDSVKYDEEYEVEQLSELTDLESGERMTISMLATNSYTMADKPAISGFISGLNGNMRALLDRLGMSVNGSVEYTTRGASPLLNLVFNTRYGISDSTIEYSDAQIVHKSEKYNLYRMNRLAGIGYMVNESIKNWNVWNDDCFTIQNNFIKTSVGGEDIFSSVLPKVSADDLYGIPLELDESYLEKGAYVYKYHTITGDVNDSVQATFVADEDMDLYMFNYSLSAEQVSVFIDGEMVHMDMTGYVQNTFHIGNVKKGQKIAIVYIADDSSIGTEKTFLLRFAKFNEEAYAKAYEKLSKNVYDIDTFESDYIKGSIKADEDGIMMTSIQALDGFDVYVDGKQVKYDTIAGALIGVPLTKGTHEVEFKYHTPVSPIGKYISIVAFLTFLTICIIDKKKKGKDIANVENEG